MSDFNPRRWVNIRVSPWRIGQFGVAWLDNFNCKNTRWCSCIQIRDSRAAHHFFAKKTSSCRYSTRKETGANSQRLRSKFKSKSPKFSTASWPTFQMAWHLVRRSHRLQVSIFTLGISTGPFHGTHFFSQRTWPENLGVKRVDRCRSWASIWSQVQMAPILLMGSPWKLLKYDVWQSSHLILSHPFGQTI